jgi:hypothetical protein
MGKKRQRTKGLINYYFWFANHGPPNIPGHARDAVGVNDGGYAHKKENN